MLCGISCHKNRQDINDNDQHVLSYNEPDLCNDYISKEQGSANRISINNFPRHCVLGHVLLDTDSLNEVDSWKEVVPPTQETKECRPTQIEANTNIKENNKQQENWTEE